MDLAVALCGAAILAVGLYGVLRPQRLIALVDALPARWRVPFFAGVRLLLGLLLLVAAPATRFPLAVRALGAIALVAAVAIVAIGRRRFDALLDGWRARPPGVVRAAALLAAGLGAFLIAAAR